MKRYSLRGLITVLACLTVLTLCLGTIGSTKDTAHYPWELMRAEAGEDPNTIIGSATITKATAGDFWSKPTDANGIINLVPSGEQKSDSYTIGIISCAGTAADKTYSVNLWAWRSTNGPAQLLCTMANTTGTMQVVKYPCSMRTRGLSSIHSGSTATSRFWSDTVSLTSYLPSSATSQSDYQGNNGLAITYVTLAGEVWLYVEVTGADGVTGTEATMVSVYFCRMSG